MIEIEPMALERYLVKFPDGKDRLRANGRQDLCDMLDRECGVSGSYGVGEHPEHGLFILMTQGQGSMLVWSAWGQE